jgi:hypothetical protein
MYTGSTLYSNQRRDTFIWRLTSFATLRELEPFSDQALHSLISRISNLQQRGHPPALVRWLVRNELRLEVVPADAYQALRHYIPRHELPHTLPQLVGGGATKTIQALLDYAECTVDEPLLAIQLLNRLRETLGLSAVKPQICRGIRYKGTLADLLIAAAVQDRSSDTVTLLPAIPAPVPITV